MSDPGAEGTPLDFHEAAAVLGIYCAVERRLFELTGAIAADPDPSPEVTVYLDSLSAEHAWHAELWADRLPVVSGIDAEALVVLPPPLEEIFGDLGSGPALDRLAGLFRVVLPRLIVSYAHHHEAASPAAEGSTRRALRLVLRDETEAWVAGEALVQRLLRTQPAVAAAGKVVVSVETKLTEAGVGPGLVPWPGRRA